MTSLMSDLIQVRYLTRHTDYRGLTPDLTRLATRYDSTENFLPTSIFTASDLISLMLLRLRVIQEVKGNVLTESKKQILTFALVHYDQAINSVATALLVGPVGRFFNLFENTDFSYDRHIVAFRQLLRTRFKIITFQDEWGGILVGDPWGLRRPKKFEKNTAALSHSQYEAIKSAKTFYLRSGANLLHGVAMIDSALIAILKWYPLEGVTYSRLQKSFNYPDIEEFEGQTSELI